jgi:uncharacterized protein (DUF486 family)
MLSHFTETPRLEKPYPRRPFPAAPDLLISIKVLVVLVVIFLGLPCNVFLTVKWMQRLEPLTKPSIAAIVLFYYVDVIPYFFMLPIIANCLNLAFGSRHQIGQIFIWGVLQFFVIYLPPVLVMAVWHFSLRGYAYAAWLSTFDEDWTENDKYALWWKLISVELWLSGFGDLAKSVGEKIESRLNSFEVSINLAISNLASTGKQKRIELELVELEKKRKMMEDIEFDDAVVSKLIN